MENKEFDPAQISDVPNSSHDNDFLAIQLLGYLSAFMSASPVAQIIELHKITTQI
jgi:hypothetical protein